MIKVFLSYSHRDEGLRNELEIHLAGLRRQGVIDLWHDRRIGAGEEFGKAISNNLLAADIILLLVSPDFIASDYCYDIEMTEAMRRHEKGEAQVIPVILRPCDWRDLPFGKLQAAPTDGKPVTLFPSPDLGFLDVVQAIKKAAKSIRRTRRDAAARTEPKKTVDKPGKPAAPAAQKSEPQVRGDDSAELLRAAERGDSEAQYKLALSSRDESFSAKWYRAAAEQGYVHAQAMLGTRYRSGWGVPKDIAEAIRWLHKAADQDDPFAQVCLGEIYDSKGDYSEALKWFKKADEQGYGNAKFHLSMMHLNGHGVEKNELKALKLLREAELLGDGEAHQMLDKNQRELRKRMKLLGIK